MKKVFTFSISCLILSILIASCGSSANFTKRRYNKGYYVSTNFKKQSVETDQTENEIISQNESNVVNENTAEENTHIKSSVESIQTEDGTSTENTSIEISSENNLSEPETEPTSNVLSDRSLKSRLNPFVKLKSTIQDKKSKSIPHSDGEALSLLWIVIVVLLILWALGLIAGEFGGLIHLLLVIALILLILWLLRVI